MKITWREKWARLEGTDETIFALNKKGETIGSVYLDDRCGSSIGAPLPYYAGNYNGLQVCNRRTREECQHALEQYIQDKTSWMRHFRVLREILGAYWSNILVIIMVVGVLGFVFWDAWARNRDRGLCQGICASQGFPKSEIDHPYLTTKACLCMPTPVEFPLRLE